MVVFWESYSLRITSLLSHDMLSVPRRPDKASMESRKVSANISPVISLRYGSLVEYRFFALVGTGDVYISEWDWFMLSKIMPVRPMVSANDTSETIRVCV